MKRCNALFYEAANLLCWFRICVSVILMVVSPGLFWAIIYALALVSDVWDGWCYRRIPKEQRPNHWFNRLPISMDPLADFAFVAGGFIHAAAQKGRGAISFMVAALILVIWQIIARKASDRIYAVMMTTLTYFWFGMMILAMVLVWRCAIGTLGLVGIVVTLVMFYACYFRLRVKTRTIRRRG